MKGMMPGSNTQERLLEQVPPRSASCLPTWTQATAFANLLKTMIGSGLLTLPWATSQFGLVLSTVGLVYLAYLSQAAIRMTVRCAALTSSSRKSILSEIRVSQISQSGGRAGASGPSVRDSLRHSQSNRSTTDGEPKDVARTAVNSEGDPMRRSTVVSDGHGAGSWQIISSAAFGEPGRLITLFFLLLAQFSLSVSYFDYVATTTETYLHVPHLQSVFCVLALLSMLSMLKQLKSVAWLSAAALIIYVYVIVLVGYFGAQELVDPSGPAGANATAAAPLALAIPSGLGLWFGPALFAFEGMGTALSIYEAMEDADPRPYFSVVSASYSVSLVLYGAIGVFGYVAWGDGVPRVVVDAFPAYNTTDGMSPSFEGELTLVAHLALAIILAFSFVLQMTPVFHVLEDVLHGTPSPRLPPILWPLTRVLIVGAVALTGTLLPDMETMVSLTGSVGLSAIGFVLPGLFFLKLQPVEEGEHERRILESAALATTIRAKETGERCARRWDTFVAWLLVFTGIVGGAFGLVASCQQLANGDAS